jgi:hypothetical protein
LTIPATKTKSIGLPADAHAPMVFATPLSQFNHNETTPTHLDGKAKTIYAATQAATKLYRRPLGCNYNFHRQLPACPDRFAALPGQLNNPGLIRNV